MSTTITNLQRGVIQKVFPLRNLIRWFDAVSALLDGFVTAQAMAQVSAAGAYQVNQGFSGAPVAVGTGQWDLTFATPIEVAKTIAHVTVYDELNWDGGITYQWTTIASGFASKIRVSTTHIVADVPTAVNVAFVVSLRQTA